MSKRRKPVPASEGKLLAYIRASTDRQVASPETQKALLCERAQMMGRVIDGFYIDKAVSGKTAVMDREAASRMFTDMKPGDTILVARLDRFSRSFIDFARMLDSIVKRGVYLHILDIPGGVFDPSNPMAEMLIGILIVFANYERRLISSRTREGIEAIRQRGERYTRHSEYGMKWEKRTDRTTGRTYEVQVEDPEERKLMLLAVELRAKGYSMDQIRQYFSYEIKAPRRSRKNGVPGGWNKQGIENFIAAGMKLLEQQSRGEGRAESVMNLEKQRGNGVDRRQPVVDEQ